MHGSGGEGEVVSVDRGLFKKEGQGGIVIHFGYVSVEAAVLDGDLNDGAFSVELIFARSVCGNGADGLRCARGCFGLGLAARMQGRCGLRRGDDGYEQSCKKESPHYFVLTRIQPATPAAVAWVAPAGWNSPEATMHPGVVTSCA